MKLIVQTWEVWKILFRLNGKKSNFVSSVDLLGHEVWEQCCLGMRCGSDVAWARGVGAMLIDRAVCFYSEKTYNCNKAGEYAVLHDI